MESVRAIGNAISKIQDGGGCHIENQKIAIYQKLFDQIQD